MAFLKLTEENLSLVQRVENQYFPLFDSYFHEEDLNRVNTQDSEKPIIGIRIIAAKITKVLGEPPEDTHIAVAVVGTSPDSNTATAILFDPGNEIALSCPPFVDEIGGMEIVIPMVPQA